jgi:hypothetical protein
VSTFKAYSIAPAYGPRTWETVRTVAKAAAADHGGSFQEEDVPATKAALIPFLNEIERQAYERGKAQGSAGSLAGQPSPPSEPPAPIEAPRPSQAPAARGIIPIAPPADGSAADKALDPLVDWIFDEAEQWQIERIMSALGVRFGETIRPRRVA